MISLLPVDTEDTRSLFCTGFPSHPLLPTDPSMAQADGHWLALGEDGRPAARCSLWWSQVPELTGYRVGLIGHFAAQDPVAAQQLLAHGCAELAAHGATLAVGPIDGSTWRPYRLITERELAAGLQPAFFLEPDNPDGWPQIFTGAGFAPLAHYFSALNNDLGQTDLYLPELQERVSAADIRIRPLEMDRVEQELDRLYELVTESFRPNFLYTPLAAAEFKAQTLALVPYIRPELVLLAEQQETLVGFIFALPDLLQAQRGESVNTLVIKTVAVAPALGRLGLGGLLGALVQRDAHRLGYTQAIHALMHETNHSRRISARYGLPMRRYTLFARACTDRNQNELPPLAA